MRPIEWKWKNVRKKIEGGKDRNQTGAQKTTSMSAEQGTELGDNRGWSLATLLSTEYFVHGSPSPSVGLAIPALAA